ncbi:MAG: L,D-transpeptidase [Bacteroidetes bacterium]|nr:L,D-transpeptidase [Bacteroidota bacterium]
MLKNVTYLMASIILFFAGMICYGYFLNLREVSLHQVLSEKGISNPQNISLVIERKKFRIDLYVNDMQIKSYRAVFGRSINRVKLSADDYVTPNGEYTICSIDTNSVYRKTFQLNYPNIDDAAEALRNKIITEKEFRTIKSAIANSGCSIADTKLGSNIGIHGMGKYDLIFKNLPFIYNWTNGSAAVSNEAIDELYSVIKVGTKVTIRY